MLRRKRRGAILLVTLVLVFVIAALVISLGGVMRPRLAVSGNVAAEREAAMTQRGAEQWVLAVLADQKVREDFDVESLDSSYFRAVPLGTGYFWIVRPDYGDPRLPTWGLVDETTKLDINTEDPRRLAQLPGLDANLAAAIVDWRDADDDVTGNTGAESQTYRSRTPPYAAKNRPFESVEELLLVEGFTPVLLFGPAGQPPLDTPSSGITSVAGLGQDLYQRRGVFDLLTVWSNVPLTAPDGRQRLLTTGDSDALKELVREIIGGDRGDQIVAALGDDARSQDIFAFAGKGNMTNEELRRLEPYLLSSGPRSEGGQPVAPGQRVRGKINLNYSPRDVLLTADPSVDPNLIDNVLATRDAQTQIFPGSIAWLREASGQALGQLDDDVTARGTHFSADIVAVSGDGRSFRRARIVVDTIDVDPKIVWRRDTTDGGWPLDPQILLDLRNGIAPQ